MIGVSNRTVYAVAALHQLGKLPAGETRKIKEIAASAVVPQNFLEQILLELKKSGILESIKGAYGGYKLNKPLKEVTLKEVITVLEAEPFSHTKSDAKALQLFWMDAKNALEESLEIPLSELMRYEQQVLGTLDYTI